MISNGSHLFVVGSGRNSDLITAYDVVNDAWLQLEGRMARGRNDLGCALQLFADDSDPSTEAYSLHNDNWRIQQAPATA